MDAYTDPTPQEKRQAKGMVRRQKMVDALAGPPATKEHPQQNPDCQAIYQLVVYENATLDDVHLGLHQTQRTAEEVLEFFDAWAAATDWVCRDHADLVRSLLDQPPLFLEVVFGQLPTTGGES